MDLGLKGKGVIVTGASKGIGRAIALEFAREGANVAICARGAEALEQTRADVAALGVKVFAASCDVGNAESLAGFINAAHAALGQVDVLVNNPSGFGVSDRITVVIHSTEETVARALREHADTIAQEVLAVQWHVSDEPVAGGQLTDADLGLSAKLEVHAD